MVRLEWLAIICERYCSTDEPSTRVAVLVLCATSSIVSPQGAEGVAADSVEAVSLYRRAIGEGGYRYMDFMHNLAILLKIGAERLASYIEEAVSLYRRAIDEGLRISKMYVLAILLASGAEGVTANSEEAIFHQRGTTGYPLIFHPLQLHGLSPWVLSTARLSTLIQLAVRLAATEYCRDHSRNTHRNKPNTSSTCTCFKPPSYLSSSPRRYLSSPPPSSM